MLDAKHIAELLRAFARHDDELGWAGSPEVFRHADEAAAFIVENYHERQD